MKNELSTLIPIKAKGEKIAAILPNAQGDTYNGAIIAGMNDLAGKLKWDLLNTVEVAMRITIQNQRNKH
jgi:hypothetical protein